MMKCDYKLTLSTQIHVYGNTCVWKYMKMQVHEYTNIQKHEYDEIHGMVFSGYSQHMKWHS